MKHRFLFFTVVVCLLLLLVNCAKRGIPTGGDPDKMPPKLVKSQPEEFSTNFDEKRIRIYFDEYIKLKDIRKQLIISPPLTESGYIIYPQSGASKYIDIKILDTLQPNTTYSFNFGQSVVDNNEENPYEYFKYVLSTGTYIDSLEIKGLVKDATLKNPDQFISVLLYAADSTYTDSIVYKKTPTYITNTLDSVTDFQLSNLKAGKYKMIALKDAANNYVFDQQTDKIGFVEDFITIPGDSTLHEITLFKETPDFKATRPAQISKKMIAFGYEGVPKDMKIHILSETPADFAFKVIPDQEKDSLQYWFKNVEADSLLFKVSKGNSAKNFTVKLKDIDRDSLRINTNYKGSLPLAENKILKILANTPIEKVNDAHITILAKDSSKVDFTSKIDVENNLLKLIFKKKESERYTVTMLPNTITDFYGETNDTLNYTLATKKETDYGNISVILNNVTSYPVILQITNDKQEVIAEEYITEPKPIYNFYFLDPGDLFMRLIFDTNKNGKWDTGNFLKNIQPERISYYPSKIKLRANWDQELPFTLK